MVQLEKIGLVATIGIAGMVLLLRFAAINIPRRFAGASMESPTSTAGL